MSNNLHTRELFDKTYGNRTWEFYRPIVSDCIEYGLPGQWLDIGAGLGLFAECANRFGIRCIGLEGSWDGVEVAKNRCPDMDIRQHLLEDRFPFEDGSISTIICYQVIEHISPSIAKQMLKECYRILKIKGVIFIYSPCVYNKEQRFKETHINLYTPKSLRKEVENSGFEILQMNNSHRLILGKTKISRYIMWTIFKFFPLDILSDSANCIAFKSIGLKR